jgi:hypothetical protein
MKVLRFLLGLAIGAGVALLVAPKSGRELREQLVGGASGRLLGAAPDEYPQPEPVADWGGAATAVAEASPVVEAEPWTVESVADEVVVTEEAVGAAEEDTVEPPSPFPVWEEPVETPVGEDLRARIDETRTTLENELAQPFADDAVVEAAAAELVAEEAVVEAVAAEIVAEEAVAEAEAAEVVAEEAVVEAVVAEEVAEDAVADALLASDADAAAAELVAEAAIEEADAAAAVAEEAVAEADVAELVAEAAIVEAVASEELAEETVIEAEVEGAVAEDAVEEADLAEAVAEEAAAEEVVADEVVAEAPLVGEGLEPFVGPAVPPQLVSDAAPVVGGVPTERPHAWDIPHDDDSAAAAALAAEPVAQEPVVEEPAAEEPIVAEEPVAAESVIEEPVAVEEPVAEEPVAEEPVVAEESAEEKVVEEPVVAEGPAVVEEPAAAAASPREGGGIDQAEMRRRIEETRARLKAKAFDAMMSGEAALLSRDSGEKPVPSADDVKIDEETDTAIDESLSQEEY